MPSVSLRSLPLVLLAAAALGPSPGQAQDADEAEVRGYYDKAAIPDRSSVFKSIGESSTRTFEKVEKALQRTDGALAKSDLSVALAQGAVEDGAWQLGKAKLDARSETFAYEFKGIQGRFDQVGVAYELAFEAALERALAALTSEKPGAIVECSPKASGSALDALAGGGPGGSADKEPACPGTNFTDEIARRWDGDEELENRLLDVVGGDLGPLVIGIGTDGQPLEYGGELDNQGWPSITGYSDADAVLPVNGQGGVGWLHPADLTVAFPELAELLDRIDELAATSRSSLSEAVAALPRDESGNLVQDEDTMAKVDAIQTRAKGIRAFTEDSRASAGKLLWEVLNKSRKKGKKAGWSEVGICLNPPAFGGCEGADVTDVVADHLGGDKKLQAALVELQQGISAPDASLD